MPWKVFSFAGIFQGVQLPLKQFVLVPEWELRTCGNWNLSFVQQAAAPWPCPGVGRQRQSCAFILEYPPGFLKVPHKRGHVSIPCESLIVQAAEPASQPCSRVPGWAGGAGNRPFDVEVRWIDSRSWNNSECTALGAEDGKNWSMKTEFNISKMPGAFLPILNYLKYPVTILRLKSTHPYNSYIL